MSTNPNTRAEDRPTRGSAFRTRGSDVPTGRSPLVKGGLRQSAYVTGALLPRGRRHGANCLPDVDTTSHLRAEAQVSRRSQDGEH